MPATLMMNDNRILHGHARDPGLPSSTLLGVRIHHVSIPELLQRIEAVIDHEERAIIANVNVHAMNLAYELAWFRQFLNQSEIVFCDGFGVKLGATIVGETIPHRFTPPDWISDLCQRCLQKDYSMYFLGAKPGVADRAAQRLIDSFPGLRIVGTHHGYFEKQPGHRDNEAVIAAILQADPDLLLIGFGMPLQEKWLVENWPQLNAHIALPAGAVFDYISGEVHRAPRWMTDRGFEWLGRLLIEPGRLWRRYVIGNPLFFWRVIKSRFSGGSSTTFSQGKQDT